MVMMLVALFHSASGRADEEDDDEPAELSETEKIAAILDLDAFAHFELKREHKTALQRKVYAKTTEYRKQLGELKEKRRELLKRRFVETVEVEIGAYDLKRRAIPLTLSQVMGKWLPGNKPKDCIGDFCFRSLPVKEIETKDDVGWDRILFVAVDEKTALRIEKSDEIEVRISFNVTRTRRVRTAAADEPPDIYIEGNNLVLEIVDGDEVVVAKRYR